MRPRTFRSIVIALGVWLGVSPFLWPHTFAQMMNGIFVGAGIVIATVLAERRPRLRYVAAALSVWLLASVWWLPAFGFATIFSQVAAAFAVLLLCLPAKLDTRAAQRHP